MRFSFLLSAWLSFVCVLATFAQNADKQQDSDSFHFYNLETKFVLENHQMQFLEELDGKKYGIEEIVTPAFQSKFKYPAKKTAFKPFTGYWLRLSLKSHLDIDSDWVLSLGKLTNAEVFFPVEEGKYHKELTGQFVTTLEKSLKNGRYNVLKVLLNAAKEKTIYVHFENQVDFPPNPNVKIVHESEWQESINLNNLTQGFFQGLLWMMLLYNFLLYLTLGDRAYAYYVFYILSTSIYFLEFHGYWSEFILGDFPQFNYIVVPFSIHVAFVFYIYFTRYFLKTHEILPHGDIFLRVIIFLFVLATGALLGLAYYNYAQYMVIEKYFNLAMEGTLLIMLIFIFTFGDISARYFALGTACMLLGGAVMLLGALHYYDLPMKIYYFQWGIVLQVLVFSFALSERFKQSEEDKLRMQSRLIDQLEENHSLYNKVQRELEDKVSERTYEIENQKIVLQDKSHEISIQHAEISEQKHLLEHKNKHITDSITYASRIQTAMLHAYNQIETRFKDAFIFFKPKDIVSGDFYWYAEVASLVRQEATTTQSYTNYNIGRTPRALPAVQIMQPTNAMSNLKIVIAADCTGHGVPGAFMTVLGNAILNEIINENRITEPEQILFELDKKVIAMLKKGDTETQLQDGMDIIVMVYDEANKKLSVSCANNALYYVRDFEIHEIKAVKSAIGYSTRKEKDFEKHIIMIQDDDIFYATSDGFQDQFGGAEKRKYMKKRMREFFLKMSHLPMAAQKEKLDEEFMAWKGQESQTDDVVIVGVKF